MMMVRFPLFLLAYLMIVFAFSHGQSILAQEATPESTPEYFIPIEDLLAATFDTTNEAPKTGQPVDLTLSVEVPIDIHIVNWPEFPKSWSELDVDQVGEIVIEEGAEGASIYRQTLTVRMWIPGEHETPETLIGYRFAGEEDVYHVRVRSVMFNVPSALETRDLNVLIRKPNRPHISSFYLSPRTIAVLVLVLLGAGGLYRRWLKQRRLVASIANKASQTPQEMILAELARLKAQEAPILVVIVSVAHGLRHYIQQQLDIPAQEMTTTELVTTLQDRLETGHLDELRRLLEQADLVKFANIRPHKRAASRMINRARRWILAIEPDGKKIDGDSGEAAK